MRTAGNHVLNGGRLIVKSLNVALGNIFLAKIAGVPPLLTAIMISDLL